MPQFAPHGSSVFEYDGQILILRSRGPFNAEHVQGVVNAFNRAAQELQPRGPWATINVIYESMLLTSEGVQAMGDSARHSRDHLGRCAAAYVVTPDVEGYSMIVPALRRVCEGILPIEFFDDLEKATAWCREQIREATQSSAGQ